MLSPERAERRVRVDVRRTDAGDAGERNTMITEASKRQSAGSAVRTPEDTSFFMHLGVLVCDLVKCKAEDSTASRVFNGQHENPQSEPGAATHQ